MRTFDIHLIQNAVAQYATAVENFDPESWLMYEGNVALTNDNEDIALFERLATAPNTVYGHYFFWSRGKDAVKAAKHFLKEIFTGNYGVQLIVGLTPTEHKGALWLNNQLRFKKLEVVPSDIGDLQMVILTKQDWEYGQL